VAIARPYCEHPTTSQTRPGGGATDGKRGQHRTRDHAGCRRNRPQTCDQGGKTDHQLQVLSDEEKCAADREDAEQIDRECRAEFRKAKEPEVNERLLKPPLSIHERDCRHDSSQGG